MGYLYPILYGNREGSAGKVGIIMAIMVLILIIVLILMLIKYNLSGGMVK